MNYRRVSSQVMVGAVVAMVGLALLLRTTNLYDTGPLFRYVPSLFVLVGVYALVASGFRNLGGPIVVILVAGAWQLVALDLVDGAVLFSFWPVLVIAFGLSLALGQVRRRPRGTDADYLDGFALFGGVDRRATSATFRKADLTALFGAATLDLRDVARPTGGVDLRDVGASAYAVDTDPIHVNATAMFGGIEIIAPRDWNVRIDALPVFGATEDERLRTERDRPDHETVDLVVDGFVAFGGISVKD